jgi:hypothetical protein
VDIGFHYVATQSYLASEGFSTNTQGANGWSYLYTTSLLGQPTTPLPSWNSTYSAWGNVSGDSYCLVGSNWQHAGNGHDSARAFQIPASGTIRIESAAWDGNNCNQDAVRVRILSGTNEVITWTQIPEGTPASAPVLLNAGPFSVAAGDWLYFQVNMNTNNSCDSVYWDPRISYQDSSQLADLDGDGLPDYAEDRDGDGVADSNETPWQVSENGTTGVTGLQVFTPLEPIGP